jgi:hypothetical protein
MNCFKLIPAHGPVPVSGAWPPNSLRSRVLSEAMAGGPDATAGQVKQRRSSPSAAGLTIILQYQTFGDLTYSDQACLLKADQTQICH